MAQKVKNLPAMQETRVQSLIHKDLLEKGMPTHSSVLICSYLRILWTEEPAGLGPWGHKESDMAERLRLFSSSVATKIEQVNMDSKRQENQEKSRA